MARDPSMGEIRPSDAAFGPFMSFSCESAAVRDTTRSMAPPVLRTLIVDDEPVARKILRDELGPLEGVQVVGEASGGAEALRQIERLRPDLVLLDLEMPGISGFE